MKEMKKKLKLKKEVKEVIILIILFALLIVCFGVMSRGDKDAINSCIEKTGDQSFCEREYYGV